MKWIALVVPLVACIACASTATTPRIRVARDFGCPVEDTRFEKISQDQPEYARWRLEGCGKSAVYLCTMPVRDCWREGQVEPTSLP